MCGDGGGGGGGGGGYSSANDPNAGMYGSGGNANSGFSGAATSPSYGGGGDGYNSANDYNAGMWGSGGNMNSGHSGAPTTPSYGGGDGGGGGGSIAPVTTTPVQRDGGNGPINGSGLSSGGDGQSGGGNILKPTPPDKVNEQGKKDTGTAVKPAAPEPEPVEKGSAAKETSTPNRPAQATPAQGSRFYRSLINYARFGSVGGTTGRTLFR